MLSFCRETIRDIRQVICMDSVTYLITFISLQPSTSVLLRRTLAREKSNGQALGSMIIIVYLIIVGLQTVQVAGGWWVIFHFLFYVVPYNLYSVCAYVQFTVDCLDCSSISLRGLSRWRPFSVRTSFRCTCTVITKLALKPPQNVRVLFIWCVIISLVKQALPQLGCTRAPGCLPQTPTPPALPTSTKRWVWVLVWVRDHLHSGHTCGRTTQTKTETRRTCDRYGWLRGKNSLT